jgi:hypothetical protein
MKSMNGILFVPVARLGARGSYVPGRLAQIVAAGVGAPVRRAACSDAIGDINVFVRSCMSAREGGATPGILSPAIVFRTNISRTASAVTPVERQAQTSRAR